MTRYALIDNYTGFVWGVTDASDPIEACALVDAETGDTDRQYDTYPARLLERESRSGYRIHKVPDDFDVEDGQNEDEIERVLSWPCVAGVCWL